MTKIYNKYEGQLKKFKEELNNILPDKPKCYGHFDWEDKCQWCDWEESCYDEENIPNCFGTYFDYESNKNKQNKCNKCEYIDICSY